MIRNKGSRLGRATSPRAAGLSGTSRRQKRALGASPEPDSRPSDAPPPRLVARWAIEPGLRPRLQSGWQATRPRRNSS